MSWDILLINSNQKLDLESETVDFPLFPPRKELVRIFQQTFPDIELSEDGWGTIDEANYSIELNLGANEVDAQDQLFLNIRGNEDPAPKIAELCKKAGWQAFDTTMGDYLDLENPTRNGFSGWTAYRNQIVETASKPWWKFW